MQVAFRSLVQVSLKFSDEVKWKLIPTRCASPLPTKFRLFVEVRSFDSSWRFGLSARINGTSLAAFLY
jgi:hypothetical protein